MNRKNIAHCRPLGNIHQDAGQVGLVIRNKILRIRERMIVFIDKEQVYAVRADSSVGINITNTTSGLRQWVGTYTTQSTRTDIRDDIQEWTATA